MNRVPFRGDVVRISYVDYVVYGADGGRFVAVDRDTVDSNVKVVQHFWVTDCGVDSSNSQLRNVALRDITFIDHIKLHKRATC